VILQLQHFAVAVGMALEIFEAGKELRAGIDVAAQHHHQRLARPGAGAAPRRVQRQVIEQRRHQPCRLVGALERGALRHGGVAAAHEFVEQPRAQRFRIFRRQRVFQFGRKFQQRRERIDEHVGVGARPFWRGAGRQQRHRSAWRRRSAKAYARTLAILGQSERIVAAHHLTC